MDSNDSIPLLLGHGGEGLVAEDTSIGNQNVDGTKGLHSGLYDGITIFSRSNSGDSLSSS